MRSADVELEEMRTAEVELEEWLTAEVELEEWLTAEVELEERLTAKVELEEKLTAEMELEGRCSRLTWRRERDLFSGRCIQRFVLSFFATVLFVAKAATINTLLLARTSISVTGTQAATAFNHLCTQHPFESVAGLFNQPLRYEDGH